MRMDRKMRIRLKHLDSRMRFFNSIIYPNLIFGDFYYAKATITMRIGSRYHTSFSLERITLMA